MQSFSNKFDHGTSFCKKHCFLENDARIRFLLSTLESPWKGVFWANNWKCPTHWVCDPELDTLREGVCSLNLLPKGLINLKSIPPGLMRAGCVSYN